MKSIKRICAGTVFLLFTGGVLAQGDVDFAISEAYLEWLAESGIQPTLAIRHEHRTASVHSLASDCEMHLAGRTTDLKLGNPPSIVVEPPNLCKNPPPKASGIKTWPSYFDRKIMKKNCVVKGFPRIFTEHAAGSENPANPNHVFEIHPATEISCDGATTSFTSFLKYYPGLRAIKPSSAQSCVTERKLDVRYNKGKDRYEFKETGGTCGNFAIVEVGFIESDWVRKIPGGHSAIARVSLDGQSRTTLKIYTLDGTSGDKLLSDVAAGGDEDKRLHIHGMFTYDYFAIVRAVRTAPPERKWTKPAEWTRVEFPLALVVFGRATKAPWGEH